MNPMTGAEPMRSVLLEWLRKVSARLAEGADRETIEKVLSTPDAWSGLSMLVDAVRLHETTLGDPLAPARARGVGSRERLIERAGGVLRLAEAARRLGVSPQAVSARRKRGTILAVPLPSGEWVYPAFQFTESGLLRGLDAVLKSFNDISAWGQLAVLTAGSRRFGGRTAIELLEQGDLHAARSIAATYGEQG